LKLKLIRKCKKIFKGHFALSIITSKEIRDKKKPY